jgi:hypothetical protein
MTSNNAITIKLPLCGSLYSLMIMVLTKLISGDNLRTSRLHDEKNNFIGWDKFFTHAPLAFSTGLLRISLDYRPELPWISYSAIQALNNFLSPNSRVLEFGSGMSTIWYAKHAGIVYSVEDYRPWYDKVSQIVKKKGLSNIHYHPP